jgi:parvulin-like peptidyl-prolyl isomerase
MTKINKFSTDREIKNMTIEQALELIQKHINLGYSKINDFKPRKHMIKALEKAAEALKFQLEYNTMK